MVISSASEARRQRILLKRELAKRENNDLDSIQIKQDNYEVSGKENEGNISQVAADREDGEVPQDKRAKLEVPDDSTTTQTQTSNRDENYENKPDLQTPSSREIVANVYRFFTEDYQYMRRFTAENPGLRALAAVRRRTAAATGLHKRVIQQILKEERARTANRPQRNRTQFNSAERTQADTDDDEGLVRR